MSSKPPTPAAAAPRKKPGPKPRPRPPGAPDPAERKPGPPPQLVPTPPALPPEQRVSRRLPVVLPGAPRRPREQVMSDLCVWLAEGESLAEACRRVEDAPTPAAVLQWAKDDPEGLGKHYAHARQTGYELLGDQILRISAETHAMVTVHATAPDGTLLYEVDGVTPVTRQVLAPLSADVLAHKRLVVDTLKWKLSKMLPRVYGDKVTQEHTGAGGGPIALTSTNLRGLSDAELATMGALLSKAEATAAKGAEA